MNEDLFHLGIKAIIRNKSGEVLLLKVNVNELHNYTGTAYWDVPGGRIQKGETVEQALKREVKEETGINNIKNIKPLIMSLSNNFRIPTPNGDVGLILSVYTCEFNGQIPKIKISEEHVEAKWFSPQETSELLKIKYPLELTSKIAQL